MPSEAAIKTLFEDAAFAAFITGGSHSFQTDTQGIGISPAATEDAYDDERLLKPTVLIRSRATVPTGQVSDEVEQIESADETVEIYFYDNKFSDWVAIEGARARAYALMNSKIVNGRHCHWLGDLRGREEALDDAARIRSAYRLTYLNEP